MDLNQELFNVSEATPVNMTSRRSFVYLWTVFVTFASLTLLALSLLLLTSGRPPMLNSSGSSQFIYFLQAKKRAIAASYTKPRLMVFGGSSSMYGLRLGYFAKALNTDAVVNMGLHAGLGLSYMLNDAKRVLRPGDTALLIIEYPLLMKADDMDWTLADYITLHDTDYLYKLSIREQFAALQQLTLDEYLDRVRDLADPHPVFDGNLADLLDGYGDVIANAASRQTPAQAAHLNGLTAPNIELSNRKGGTDRQWVANPERLRELSSFIAWCRTNNIRVVASYPPFLDFSEYKKSDWRRFFDSFARFYKSENVPTLGTPYEFLYPKNLFFDSDFHLNSEGSELMSKQMATRIKQLEIFR